MVQSGEGLRVYNRTPPSIPSSRSRPPTAAKDTYSSVKADPSRRRDYRQYPIPSGYSPKYLEKPYEKSGEGPNHYPTKRRKRLDRAPFQCFALPKNLSKGPPNHFSYGFSRQLGE